MVTTLARSTVGVVIVFSRWLLVDHWDAVEACNGFLGGFVAITFGCLVVKAIGEHSLGFVSLGY